MKKVSRQRVQNNIHAFTRRCLEDTGKERRVMGIEDMILPDIEILNQELLLLGSADSGKNLKTGQLNPSTDNFEINRPPRR